MAGEMKLADAYTVLFSDAPENCGDISTLSPGRLKAAYRRQALRCHPDTGGNAFPDTSEQFLLVRQSFEVLSRALRQKQKHAGAGRKGKHPSRNDRPRGDSERTERASSQRFRRCTDSAQEIFYHGSIPSCRLRLAEYLYYRGIISWSTMIRAIVWQKSTGGNLIGRYFLEHGVLDEDSFVLHLREFHCHNFTYQDNIQ